MSDKTSLPTVDENPERCETCRYWQPELLPDEERIARERGDDTEGACLRFPSTEEKSHYEWCGEWRAKRPAPDLPRPSPDAA